MFFFPLRFLFSLFFVFLVCRRFMAFVYGDFIWMRCEGGGARWVDVYIVFSFARLGNILWIFIAFMEDFFWIAKNNTKGAKEVQKSSVEVRRFGAAVPPRGTEH
ncbi:hypothetical protein V8C34DRAFT_280339 [Trichoderma compactum]